MAERLSVLVSGAGGFVGGVLCPLLQPQFRVRGLVRLAGAAERLRQQGVEPLLAELAPDSMFAADALRVDVIVHLAAKVHVMAASAADRDEHDRINHRTTLNLARQAAAAGVRRFIYLSTIKVNGERTQGRPFTADSPADPCDSYARSKWAAEQGLAELAAQTGMELVIIRPPLVYGPGVKANFAQLVRWVAKGVPLPLAGIHNRRSLVSVDNLCDLIRCCITHSAAPGQRLLVSDGEAISTAALCRRIAHAAGVKAPLFYFPQCGLKLAATLVGKSAALNRLTEDLEIDSSATEQLLDWHPPVSMAETLNNLVRSP